MQYHVRESFLAVRSDPSQCFITVAPGSVIIVQGQPGGSGLIDIVYKGSVVAAFMRDIVDRCDQVQAKGA